MSVPHVSSCFGESKSSSTVVKTLQFRLMDLFERFTNYCKTHNLVFWLDPCSLSVGPGYLLFPFEKDIRIGMLEGDYKAFVQQLIKDERKEDGRGTFKCLFNYTEGKDFSFILELNAYEESVFEVQIITPSFVVDSNDSTTLIEKYPVDRVRRGCSILLEKTILRKGDSLHLHDLVILGKLVKASTKYLQLIEEREGKNAEERFRSLTRELYTSEPFRTIPSHSSEILLNEAFEEVCEPFIIHNSKEFCFTHEDLTQIFLKQKDTWGYRTDTVVGVYECDFLPSTSLYHQWEENVLKLNLVDTECDDSSLFPEYFKSVSDFRSYFVLSPVKVWTEFHEDNGEKGGGWMYLKVGKKVWHCISPADMTYLKEHGYDYDQINHLSVTELLHILDCYLWGKIYVGIIGDNDFLYFPPWWAHSVYTEEKSFGIGGYFNCVNFV
jgi:hypothetical protein